MYLEPDGWSKLCKRPLRIRFFSQHCPSRTKIKTSLNSVGMRPVKVNQASQCLRRVDKVGSSPCATWESKRLCCHFKFVIKLLKCMKRPWSEAWNVVGGRKSRIIGWKHIGKTLWKWSNARIIAPKISHHKATLVLIGIYGTIPLLLSPWEFCDLLPKRGV